MAGDLKTPGIFTFFLAAKSLFPFELDCSIVDNLCCEYLAVEKHTFRRQKWKYMPLQGCMLSLIGELEPVHCYTDKPNKELPAVIDILTGLAIG